MYRKALSFSIIIIFTYTAQAQFRQCPDTVIVIDDSVYRDCRKLPKQV